MFEDQLPPIRRRDLVSSAEGKALLLEALGETRPLTGMKTIWSKPACKMDFEYRYMAVMFRKDP